MFQAITGISDEKCNGCLLADSEELGVFLETIALIYSLLYSSTFKLISNDILRSKRPECKLCEQSGDHYEKGKGYSMGK